MVILNLDDNQFAEVELLFQDRVRQLLQAEPGIHRNKKLTIVQSIIKQFPARNDNQKIKDLNRDDM